MLIYCEKKKTVLTENWINHVKEVIKNIENLLDIKIERSETNRLVNLIKCWLFLYDKTGIHESYSKGDIITQNNKFVIKYDKKIPSTNEIKKLL